MKTKKKTQKDDRKEPGVLASFFMFLGGRCSTDEIVTLMEDGPSKMDAKLKSKVEVAAHEAITRSNQVVHGKARGKRSR
jgi:hypothetical protein